MANIISSGDLELCMSNGETSVFIDVLSLAMSGLAVHPWQKALASWFAMHDQSVFGTGCVGFDLSELGWSSELDVEKAFVLESVDAAIAEAGWERLGYLPQKSVLLLHLERFKVLVSAATPVVQERDWAWQETRPAVFRECQVCGVYLHIAGCVVCKSASQ